MEHKYPVASFFWPVRLLLLLASYLNGSFLTRKHIHYLTKNIIGFVNLCSVQHLPEVRSLPALNIVTVCGCFVRTSHAVAKPLCRAHVSTHVYIRVLLRFIQMPLAETTMLSSAGERPSLVVSGSTILRDPPYLSFHHACPPNSKLKLLIHNFASCQPVGMEPECRLLHHHFSGHVVSLFVLHIRTVARFYRALCAWRWYS